MSSAIFAQITPLLAQKRPQSAELTPLQTNELTFDELKDFQQ